MKTHVIDALDRLGIALAGRYSLERELGRGGMAAVYLAQDLRHERPVAVKVLHRDLAATLGPERFQREIRVGADFVLRASLAARAGTDRPEPKDPGRNQHKQLPHEVLQLPPSR